MNAEELKDLVNQRAWSKQVIVWIGEQSRLDQLLEGKSQRVLDVLELIPEDEEWPSDFEDRADWLRSQLDERVQGLRPSDAGHAILRVRNAALLAKLEIGLQPFFDWFAGSSTMTVLEVEPIKPVRLPDTVASAIRADSDWLASRLQAWLSRPEHLCHEV